MTAHIRLPPLSVRSPQPPCQLSGPAGSALWPAFWLLNDDPARGGEVDLVEWYGNRDWPSGTTVHARLDGTSFATDPHPIDSGWHTWRMTWQPTGMYFWKDYVPGQEPFFTVPANSLDDWPFNDPGYTLAPVFNLAVGGSGVGGRADGPSERLDVADTGYLSIIDDPELIAGLTNCHDDRFGSHAAEGAGSGVRGRRGDQAGDHRAVAVAVLSTVARRNVVTAANQVWQ